MDLIAKQAVAAIAAGVLSVSTVFAGNISITETGPDSSNRVVVSSNDRISVRNTNNVDVDNDIDQRAHTGDALVTRNTNGGDATSGDAENNSEVLTEIIVYNGSGGWDFDWWLGGGDWDASIDTTGPDSVNRINLSSASWLSIRNRNNVDVDNDINQRARTGDATVSRNTNAGDATTGDASNDSDVGTWVEIENAGLSGGSSGGGGHMDASIDTTGPDSTNRINVTSRNRVNISNRNDVDVDTSTTQTATSGDATVSRNTNAGDATTGDASNDSVAETGVEIENAGLSGGSSGGGGHVDASIDTTGPDSTNTVTVSSTNSLSISNSNDVSVGNDVNQTASTGDATVSQNTNAGDATTGAATNTSSVGTSISISS